MKLGIVKGSVVASKKTGNTEGRKILVVELIDEAARETGHTLACIDTTGAGSGDVVVIVSSSSARLTKLTKDVCTDNTIIAIVDNITSNGKYIYRAAEKNGN
jgi:microcompartment protein CcmK/EutM